MRSIAIRKLLLALFALSAPGAGWGKAVPSPVRILDPLTGLRWSPATVAFVPLGGDVIRRCDNLSNDNYDHQLWVLAKAGDLLVVSGRYVPRRAGLDSSEGDLGAVIRVGASGCAMIGPARDLFVEPSDYAPDVSAAEATALATDAASRYVTAWRGPAGLCVAMRRQGKRLASLPATLKAPFRAAAPCLR